MLKLPISNINSKSESINNNNDEDVDTNNNVITFNSTNFTTSNTVRKSVSFTNNNKKRKSASLDDGNRKSESLADGNRKSVSFSDTKKFNTIKINFPNNEQSIKNLNISINNDDNKSENNSKNNSPNNMLLNSQIINAATKLREINKKLVVNKVILVNKSKSNKIEELDNDSNVLKSVQNVLDIASNLIRVESTKTEDVFSSLMDWDLTFLNQELEDPYIKVHSGFIAPFYVQFIILLFAFSVDAAVLLKYFSPSNSNISENLSNPGVLIFYTICGLLLTLIFPFIAFSKILTSTFNFYTIFTISLGILFSTLRVLLISVHGLPSHVGMALLLFFYLRGRFKPLCIILFYDLILTNLWYGLYLGKSARLFIVADIFLISMDIITCFSAYYYELGNRTSYLSFLQCVHEQQKTQSILDSIFPDHITARIKERNGRNTIIAHAESDVTVMFCDILQFQDMIQFLSPTEFVCTLNELYSAMDFLCGKYFVQKMETVGKTYMACGGLPGTRKRHALAVVNMCFEIIDVICRAGLKVNIGVNTGPVIAGIVGLIRPQYSLFGDTVNTAARHASTAPDPNCVHLSISTYQFIKRRYNCVKKVVSLKGKGLVTSYIAYPSQLNADKGIINPVPIAVNNISMRLNLNSLAPRRRRPSNSQQNQLLTTPRSLRINKINTSTDEIIKLPVVKTPTNHLLLEPTTMKKIKFPTSSPRGARKISPRAKEIKSNDDTQIIPIELPKVSSLKSGTSTSPKISTSFNFNECKSLSHSASRGVGISFSKTDLNDGIPSKILLSGGRINRSRSISSITSGTSTRSNSIKSISKRHRSVDLGKSIDDIIPVKKNTATSSILVEKFDSFDVFKSRGDSRISLFGVGPYYDQSKLNLEKEEEKMISAKSVDLNQNNHNRFRIPSNADSNTLTIKVVKSEIELPEIEMSVMETREMSARSVSHCDNHRPSIITNTANYVSFNSEPIDEILPDKSEFIISPWDLNFITKDSEDDIGSRDFEKKFCASQQLTWIQRGRLPCLLSFCLQLFEIYSVSDSKDDSLYNYIIVLSILAFFGLFLLLISYFTEFGEETSAEGRRNFHRAQIAYLFLPIVLNYLFFVSTSGTSTLYYLNDYSPILIHLIYTTFFSNSGNRIKFMLPITYFVSILWFGTYIYYYSSQSLVVGPADDFFQLLFWIILASVLNGVNSYFRELYFRQRYLFHNKILLEQLKAERILYHMLPRKVAKFIISSGAKNIGIANEYPKITMLYSDIKGFTQYSASSSPENVVELLSTIFTEFDKLTLVFNVYKLQTIGDAYVLVSGLPFLKRCSTSLHAYNCIQIGFAMLSAISRIRTVEGGEVSMRVGIHTGSVIAGVVGNDKFRYDMWGTDCFIANNCETMSIPGAILVSEKTIDLVGDYYSVDKLSRGPLITVASPPLETYYLIPPNSNIVVPLFE